MESRKEFLKKVSETISRIDPEILQYNEDEYWMYRSAYEYVDFYATTNRFWNTKLALFLARGLHNGSYRKSSVIKDGVKYRLPYIIHPLSVCRFLIDLQLLITKDEEDILLATALCHDMIEDIPFKNKGRELVTDFYLSEKVYEAVMAVSKNKEASPEEERAYFKKMEENKLAMLVKLSDRGNNVEDLYNMTLWKIHEYADETRRFFIPMCESAKERYPELKRNIQMLKNKMITLTEAAETLAEKHNSQEEALVRRLDALRSENLKLRSTWQELWNS